MKNWSRMQNTADLGVFYQCEEYAFMLHIILLRAHFSRNVNYWSIGINFSRALRNWYQVFTVWNAKYEFFGSTVLHIPKFDMQHEHEKSWILTFDPTTKVGGWGSAGKIFATRLRNPWFYLIWCATWQCSEKWTLTFWSHPQGQVGSVCGQNVCYHVAAFVIPFNLNCNMTMLWKSWISTFWPPGAFLNLHTSCVYMYKPLWFWYDCVYEQACLTHRCSPKNVNLVGENKLYTFWRYNDQTD